MCRAGVLMSESTRQKCQPSHAHDVAKRCAGMAFPIKHGTSAASAFVLHPREHDFMMGRLLVNGQDASYALWAALPTEF